MRYREKAGRAPLLFGLVVLGALLPGCGKKGWLETYPVKGTILVDGQPAKEVFVSFHPKEDVGNRPYFPSGRTNENGEFVLSTFVEGDGAPAGEYDVTVTWPVRYNPISTLWEGDKLKGQYSNKAKPAATVTIEKKPQELAPFELKSGGPK
jgi:hypothetical protein